LLDHLTSTFAVDRKRVLCTGYSMGGAGTWYFITHHPDRFSAAIPIAGRPPDGEPAATKVPLYVIHSRADEVVPLAPTESYVAALPSLGAEGQLTIVAVLPPFQTGGFVAPRRAALPWLTRVWK